MRRQFGNSPLWLPTTLVSLGDYGFYINGQFEQRGNVFNDFGLDPKAHIPDNPNPPKFSYLILSEGADDLQTSAQGSDGKIDVSLKIEFQRSVGYVLQMFETQSKNMIISQDLQDAVQAASNNGKWDPDYRIVQNLVTADFVKFAFTSERDSSLELVAKADSNVFDIASLNLSVKSRRKVDVSLWLVSGQATPLVNFVTISDSNVLVAPTPQLLSPEFRKTLKLSDAPVIVSTTSESFTSLTLGISDEED